jgi:hypothetical protein
MPGLIYLRKKVQYSATLDLLRSVLTHLYSMVHPSLSKARVSLDVCTCV